MKDQLNSLLTKEMDRKDFVKTLGVGAMLVLGGGLVLNALGKMNGSGAKTTASTFGYGSSAYGGNAQLPRRS